MYCMQVMASSALERIPSALCTNTMIFDSSNFVGVSWTKPEQASTYDYRVSTTLHAGRTMCITCKRSPILVAV